MLAFGRCSSARAVGLCRGARLPGRQRCRARLRARRLGPPVVHSRRLPVALGRHLPLGRRLGAGTGGRRGRHPHPDPVPGPPRRVARDPQGSPERRLQPPGPVHEGQHLRATALRHRPGREHGAHQRRPRRAAWPDVRPGHVVHGAGTAADPPRPSIEGWMAADPELKEWEYYFSEMWRQQEHTLSADGERLMAIAGRMAPHAERRARDAARRGHRVPEDHRQQGRDAEPDPQQLRHLPRAPRSAGPRAGSRRLLRHPARLREHLRRVPRRRGQDPHRQQGSAQLRQLPRGRAESGQHHHHRPTTTS